MRSRYSAYALKLANYIIETTDPASPHFQKNLSAWRKNILAFGNLNFTGLDILEAKDDTVAFKAHLKDGSRDASFIEKSLFTKKSNRWLYLKAE